MNKREQRRQVEKELTENITIVDTWQKKPYTAVHITAYYGTEVIYEEYGFTKVCWPDKWNAEYGIELAVQKAIADISRKIIGEFEV